ncbi:MAG: hypothetical protein ACTSXL_06175 [Alphaproteobacteria bacterium]
MKKFIIILLIFTSGFAFSASLNNGNISIEVDGDGDVGLVEYGPIPGSNHVSFVGVNLHYDSSLHDMDYIPGVEKNYTGFAQRKMFTGYGRDSSSNFYVYSVSHIEGANSTLEQTLVYTMRKKDQLKMSYTVDSRVMQTDTNDVGSFNIANQTLMFEEDSVCLGFAARLNGAKITSHIYSGYSDVLDWLQTASNTTVGEENLVNAAGAVSWASAATDGTPRIIKTKLMVASSNSEIQPMSSFTDDSPVHVADISMIEIKTVKFSQKFNKPNKDKIKIKGSVNIEKYGTALDNLASLDVSFMIGDYIGFTPDDKSELKVKPTKRIHQLKDDSKGVRKLIIKRKKKSIDFIFSASKIDLSGATMLNANSGEGENIPILLPLTLVLTGNSSLDSEKGGEVYILPFNIPLTYKKKNEKKAVGKQ